MNKLYSGCIFFIMGITCLFTEPVSAQVFGNEWIVKNQSYYRIKVHINGIYRISYTDMQAAGMPVSAIDPRNIQLFLNGSEQPLYIPGQSDGIVDPGDYIEFFGKKNDGALDAALYVTPGAQPHPYYSLYSDTSVYFLTWTGTIPGKRFSDFYSANYTLTPETYFNHESYSFFPEVYYKGKNLTSDGATLSEYTAGEGWLGAQFAMGSSQTRSVNCEGFYTNGQPAVGTFSVFGRSDAGSAFPNYNHHLKVETSPDNITFFAKKDTLYKGYAEIRSALAIPSSEISNKIYFKFSSVNDLSAVTDFNAVSFIRLIYPRNFDLYNTDSLLFSFTGLNASPNSLAEFLHYSSSGPVIFDLTNSIRIRGTLSSDTFKAVIPNAGVAKQLYLGDSLDYHPAVLQKVNFNFFDPAVTAYNYLMVTHEKLLPAAAQYAAYRSSGGYKVLTVTSQDLYDQFYYGQRHPLAVRRFCQFMLKKGMVKPQYLLLLGKGQQTSRVRDPLNFPLDLVPSIGMPPSDAMFTSGLDSTILEPAIATGRVAAQTIADVQTYLEKLISYESLPDSLWRKDLLHLSGGRSVIENQSFSGALKSFASHAVKPDFGARIIPYYKDVNEPVTDNLKGKIIEQIDAGVSLVSYFGHGSNLITEINFGQPYEMHNKDRYTTFLLNGCSVGNPNGEVSMGEGYMFEKQKAAIAWLANSDLGYESYLYDFTNEFYRQAFNVNYGKPIAEILRQTVKAFQVTTDSLNRNHCRQYYFQGDPALRFYSPPLPDYQISKEAVFIYPEHVNALSDSFAVALIVKNPGKALNDSLKIGIKRTLADQSVTDYGIVKFTPVYNRDTLFYWIESKDIRTRGLNKFEISLDADFSIVESDETNNTVSFDFIMPAHTVNILFPQPNSIVPDSTVRFLAQSNNLFLKNAEYIFEIDTLKTFSSPWKTSSGIISAGIMPEWKPAFKLIPGQVYYWRVRFNIPPEEGGDWQEASFTAIPGSPEGWSQSTFEQLYDASLKNMVRDSIKKTFDFAINSAGVWIQTRGDDASKAEERTIRINNSKPVFFDQEFTGFSILSIHPVTLERFSYASKYNPLANTLDYPYSKYGYSGNFFFNVNNAEARDSLLYYLQSIPDGYAVMGYNGRSIDLSALPAPLLDAFELVGCTLIRTVPAGFPYLFYGVKGAAPGTAIEATADTVGSAIPGRQQQIRVEKEYDGKWDHGSVTSSLIGPAKSWSKVYISFETETNDTVLNEVLGVDKNGKETVLLSNIGDSLDLSLLNAANYPYIRIKSTHTDKPKRTPALFNYWKVLYENIPEATFNPEARYSFYKEELQEGDSLRISIAYQNISDHPTDFLSARYTLTKPDRSEETKLFGTFQPIDAGDTLILRLALPTKGLEGNNSLALQMIPGNGLDRYAYNNMIQQPFTVKTDTRAPLLDVVVDGKHIMNGEIIKPDPLILISSSDENKFLLLNDTSAVDIYLRNPDESDFRKVSYTGAALQFKPASSAASNKAVVEYKPGYLPDGIYTLKVRAKDASGNYNASNDYEISFEVVNETSITHFFPYPNPFTTSMRFVYTLTGAQSPDQLKIQIMNINGKVVREITKAEFGPMQTGNNISEFAWNGTDQFGDRLANGVYFYRVLVKMQGQDIKKRNTSADKFVEKGFGKIYLMR